jgi:predicted dehydrogenase
VQLILTAAIPADRAAVAIEAMRAGKDVMTDKPGCTNAEQLAALRRAVAETGRIWSVTYGRFESAAMARVLELIAAGAIGRVVQTTSLGPHRLNRHLRPSWFFQRDKAGSILCDIGCHQIDQFLALTGSPTAQIISACVGNFANPGDPDFDDFGEMLLRNDAGRGYARLDWYTPDGLATWGDGRLFVLGTHGYIELRKNIDIDGRPGIDHLFLVDNQSTRHVDCSAAGRPYYRNLIADVLDRTETAMTQSHCFKVMELALEAEATATRLGRPAQAAR